MKRHQIISPTCKALDITNATPEVLPENQVKEDLANNQVDKDLDDTGSNSEVVKSSSEDTELEEERPIKKRKKILRRPQHNKSSSEDTESEEERPIKKRKMHRKRKIHRKRRKILKRRQHNFEASSLHDSNIVRTLRSGAVRIPARLRPPLRDPYTSALMYSQRV
jgi:hypothetical protein